MNKQKGFTIIELIVVIAIIAVLAAIVLVNVTQYINKGKDAAAQGNLDTMLTDAAIFYANSGSYAGFLTDPTYLAVSSALTTSSMNYTITTAVGNSTLAGSTWCASVVLKSGSTFCVDSSGKKESSTGTTDTCTTATGTTQGTCP
jgi:prepilin-type N-terminal cleavage/methylation domain-containing protein